METHLQGSTGSAVGRRHCGIKTVGCQGKAPCCHSWSVRGPSQGEDSLRSPGGLVAPPPTAEGHRGLSCKEGVPRGTLWASLPGGLTGHMTQPQACSHLPMHHPQSLLLVWKHLPPLQHPTCLRVPPPLPPRAPQQTEPNRDLGSASMGLEPSCRLPLSASVHTVCLYALNLDLPLPPGSAQPFGC